MTEYAVRPTGEHPWRDKKCRSGKLTFVSADEARLYAANAGIPLATYHCSDCSRFHLTNSDEGEAS